jgi:hypothetical protein
MEKSDTTSDSQITSALNVDKIEKYEIACKFWKTGNAIYQLQKLKQKTFHQQELLAIRQAIEIKDAENTIKVATQKSICSALDPAERGFRTKNIALQYTNLVTISLCM